ncbi:hypothetical protein RRSWK_05251 [Rhodopirellula sp. SWK7]|nr:hypothetical protein RRSWK_05251 [Rhodopirellula sp. SWK7]
MWADRVQYEPGNAARRGTMATFPNWIAVGAVMSLCEVGPIWTVQSRKQDMLNACLSQIVSTERLRSNVPEMTKFS